MAFTNEERYQIELTPSITILWLFICHNIEPTMHHTTFLDPKASFLYHLVWGQKIDLASLIYEQIHKLGVWGDRRNSLVFPSLISGICKSAGITFLSGKHSEKPSPFIKLITLEAQDIARAKHRELQERAN